MIVFEFSDEIGQSRLIYWVGATSCTGSDSEHSDEIYEQLDAQHVGWA